MKIQTADIEQSSCTNFARVILIAMASRFLANEIRLHTIVRVGATSCLLWKRKRIPLSAATFAAMKAAAVRFWQGISSRITSTMRAFWYTAVSRSVASSTRIPNGTHFGGTFAESIEVITIINIHRSSYPALSHTHTYAYGQMPLELWIQIQRLHLSLSPARSVQAAVVMVNHHRVFPQCQLLQFPQQNSGMPHAFCCTAPPDSPWPIPT